MNTSQQFESFLPVYDTCPEDWEDARAFLAEQLKKISNAVNIREIGWWLDQELLSGKSFIPGANSTPNESPDQYRQIYRKIVDFGTLPNTTSKSVAHGINVDANFSLIQIYAGTTNPNTFFQPIPFVEAIAPTGSIQLHMTPTDVVITTDSDRTAFTRTYVTIEYIKEL